MSAILQTTYLHHIDICPIPYQSRRSQVCLRPRALMRRAAPTILNDALTWGDDYQLEDESQFDDFLNQAIDLAARFAVIEPKTEPKSAEPAKGAVGASTIKGGRAKPLKQRLSADTSALKPLVKDGKEATLLRKLGRCTKFAAFNWTPGHTCQEDSVDRLAKRVAGIKKDIIAGRDPNAAQPKRPHKD